MTGRKELERVWKAPMATVWELWSTAEGLASWWGPPGFTVEVEAFDLRPGGSFAYTMRATSPDMIASMEARGRPTSHGVSATFTVVDPPRALARRSPWGDEALLTSVTFEEVVEGVKMTLVLEATQEGMTDGAFMGWKGSLERFAERLSA